MLQNIIIEGVDRLGKDTLIQGLQDKLGFFQVIHYQKPLLLNCFKESFANIKPSISEKALTTSAYECYQFQAFEQMLRMLSAPFDHYILNRAHLGEFVYAKRYRGYDGSYVFNSEKTVDLAQKIKNGFSFVNNTLLVLLYTSNFSFIQDDGQSLDFSKKEEEQADFKEAFYQSNITHKLMIDVYDPETKGFKDKNKILNQVAKAYGSKPVPPEGRILK